eukprot:m.171197 g.171197  ORF g.171197 m.171197 type:complete len:623 (-) comp31640_c0_seq1:69-1937(-)
MFMYLRVDLRVGLLVDIVLTSSKPAFVLTRQHSNTFSSLQLASKFNPRGTISRSTMGRFRWVAAGIATVGTAFGAQTVKTRHENDEGFRRGISLYTKGGPVIIHYRYREEMNKMMKKIDAMEVLPKLSKSQAEQDQEWQALDDRYSGEMLEMLQDLKGMYTKYGQIGAGLTNTFSKTWIEKLRKLEDQVEPQPSSVVNKTIAQELGKPLEEVFESFDEAPLGSASIGQVHRATLRDGREVAVKVQYPDSERLFRNDMKTIRGFFEIFAPEQVIILSELERSFEAEFNYVEEAQNLVEVWNNLKKAHFEAECYVPQPFPEYCTRRVLVMELLKGPKLKDGLTAYGKILAAEKGLTYAEFEDQEREKIEREGATPYTGPDAAQLELYLSGKRWKEWATASVYSVYNHTLGYLSGPITIPPPETLPPNCPRIIDALMRIHGHQLFENGLFNADPHAGNFLLLTDGRIGLIDYGSTKRLSNSERLIACVLYAALAKNDKDMVVNICINGGYKSKYFNHDVIMKLCQFGFDTYSKDLLEGKNVQQFIDDLYAADPYTEMADNLTMVNFLSIRLRSLAMQMGHPVTCSEYWGKLAEEVLQEEGYAYDSITLDVLNEIAPIDSMTISKG